MPRRDGGSLFDWRIGKGKEKEEGIRSGGKGDGVGRRSLLCWQAPSDSFLGEDSSTVLLLYEHLLRKVVKYPR